MREDLSNPSLIYLQEEQQLKQAYKMLYQALTPRSAHRQQKGASTYNAYQKSRGQDNSAYQLMGLEVYQVCKLRAPAGSTLFRLNNS